MSTPEDPGTESAGAEKPAFVLLPKNDPFAAANALRALGGVAPLPHEVRTFAKAGDGGSGQVWLAECACGWRGPDRDDEHGADADRLGHDDAPPTD